MKKLITTMSAVAVALSLSAAGTLPTGTSFEGLTADAAYDITANTGELSAQAEGASYWGYTTAPDTLKIVASTAPQGIAYRPTAFVSASQTNCLSIKTTLGNPISRYVNADQSAQSIGNGIYFDSFVKFTAFDGDAPALSSGGKLAIWLKEEIPDNATDATATNLWITAGFLDGNNVVTTNYECSVGSGVDLNDGGWHRVTVKALETIYKNASTPGFVVFVDQEAVTTDTDVDKGIVTTSLTDNAGAFNNNGALFPSAVQSGDAKSTITAVDFDGQGEVDDIVFTATAPNFAVDYEFFTINLGANISGAEYVLTTNGTAQLPVTISGTTQIPYVAGMLVTITDVTPATGYVEGTIAADQGVTVNNKTFEPSGAEQSITINAAAAVAYVGETAFGTLTEAETYVNGRTTAGNYTLKLGANATSGITINNANEGVNIILDLAGKTITGAADQDTIYLEAGSLTIIDSDKNGAGTVVAGANANALGNKRNTVLVVNAGKYNGTASLKSGATLYGGSYTAADNSDQGAFVGADYLATGYVATLDNGYYVVTVAPVAQIGTKGYASFAEALAAAEDGDTITLLANITESGFQLADNTFASSGLTINLGGYTYTINDVVDDDPIDVRKGNTLTISNGTIAVASAFRDVARIYGNASTTVTFNDVTINGSNLAATASDKPVGALQIEGGSVNITGSTSISTGNAPYAIKFGNHAHATDYVCGTLTLDTTGNIVGNILLSGGTYVETSVGTGSNIAYVYGKNAYSEWRDANNTVFAARDGELPETGAENNVAGNLYKTFAAAIAATNEFTLLANYAGDVTFAVDTKITANNYELTGTLTAPSGYVVNLVDGVYQAELSASYDAGSETACADADAAAALAAAINASKATMIAVPTGISDDNGAYTGLFQATVDGTAVKVEFTDAAKLAQSNLLATATLAAPLATAAAASADTEYSFTGTPGLWYSVKAGNALNAMTEGAREMAGATGAVTVTLPKASTDTAGFFQLVVSEADKPAAAPATND